MGFSQLGQKEFGFTIDLLAWYPVYADIEKTADNGTEYKNHYRDQVVHLPLDITLFV